MRSPCVSKGPYPVGQDPAPPARDCRNPEHVERRFGSALVAYAWYRSEPLPGFGGQTAMQLVRDGKADENPRFHRCCGRRRLCVTATRYRGLLCRAQNPIHSRDPRSGRGPGLYDGRFNRRSADALYTALDAQTAILEANQVGIVQPTMLLAYQANIDPVFNMRDEIALAARGRTAKTLAEPAWRSRMNAGRPVAGEASGGCSCATSRPRRRRRR